jgi:hypothetical protein
VHVLNARPHRFGQAARTDGGADLGPEGAGRDARRPPADGPPHDPSGTRGATGPGRAGRVLRERTGGGPGRCDRHSQLDQSDQRWAVDPGQLSFVATRGSGQPSASGVRPAGPCGASGGRSHHEQIEARHPSRGRRTRLRAQLGRQVCDPRSRVELPSGESEGGDLGSGPKPKILQPTPKPAPNEAEDRSRRALDEATMPDNEPQVLASKPRLPDNARPPPRSVFEQVGRLRWPHPSLEERDQPGPTKAGGLHDGGSACRRGERDRAVLGGDPNRHLGGNRGSTGRSRTAKLVRYGSIALRESTRASPTAPGIRSGRPPRPRRGPCGRGSKLHSLQRPTPLPAR